MEKNKHHYVVILAGGGGTRLWPRSRTKMPKQFLKLVGDQTMLQLTAHRAHKLVDWDHIIIVTNQDHAQMVKSQLPEIKETQIILEPEKKDTALAMLVGALYAYSLDKKAIVINCASDHYLTDMSEFIKTMKEAAQLASQGDNLITVGIAPTHPETGFGYIKIGDQLKNHSKSLPVFKVDNFTEKPNATTAAAFIATGKYFWNANMYVWSSQALINAFKNHAPKIWQIASPLIGAENKNFQSHLPDIYTHTNAISIDYAISEKADNLLLLPGNFGWSDIGDWKVAYQLGKKDYNNNVHNDETNGQAKFITNSSYKNLLASSNPRLVALLGVENLVIVDTPEILLIAHQDKTQEVKQIVESLKQKKKTEYL